MGWKTIPGTGGWEVYDKLTWNGRHRFRYAENGNPTRTGFVPREKLIARLGSFFDLTRNGIDQRIETTDNGEITLRVAVEESDFKLFCTSIDSSTFKAVKLHWDRGRWRELEEQKLMEKCLDELYELGELTLQTGDELAEYEEFLKLKDP